MTSSQYSRSLGRLTYPETVKYYYNPSEYVGTRANTDSETAFMQAIMWYITGDETYRSNAMHHQRLFCHSRLRYPCELPFCYNDLFSRSSGNFALFRYAYGESEMDGNGYGPNLPMRWILFQGYL